MYLSGLRREVCAWKIPFYSGCSCICGGLIFIFFFSFSPCYLSVAPPSFVEWPESLTRPRAGTARFACQAEGNPAPKISWLKNGRRIHSNGRIKMYNR